MYFLLPFMVLLLSQPLIESATYHMPTYVVNPPLTAKDLECLIQADTTGSAICAKCSKLIVPLMENGKKVEASEGTISEAVGVTHPFSIDALISPCYQCGDAAGQGKTACEVNNSATTHNLQRVWFDVQNPSAWSGSPADNVGFLKTLIDSASKTCRVAPRFTGILTSSDDWRTITGNTTDFSQYALGLRQLDGQATFVGFQPFGGWTEENLIAKLHSSHVRKCDIYFDKVLYACTDKFKCYNA